jgi:large subunit ribosomal protein L35
MPKVRSRSSVKKRFRLTAKGHLKRKKAFKSHILNKKSTKRKRKLRRSTLVNPNQESKMRLMLSA